MEGHEGISAAHTGGTRDHTVDFCRLCRNSKHWHALGARRESDPQQKAADAQKGSAIHALQ
jgi:hypothetical protein